MHWNNSDGRLKEEERDEESIDMKTPWRTYTKKLDTFS